jgi:hypothetical protein
MTLSIDQAVCNSFKSQLLDGDHDFSSAGGNVFKLALYPIKRSIKCNYYSFHFNK